MYKTVVYTLVSGNIQRLAHRKLHKFPKMILPSLHWLRVSVLLNNITFCNFCSFWCAIGSIR